MALSANFIADFSSFIDATKDSVAAMVGFKETAETLGPASERGLSLSEKQMEAAGQAARRLGTDIVTTSKDFIAAFSESEAAVGRLTGALKASGQATPEVKKAYADMALDIQNTTRFSDEAVTDLQATLTTIGHVGPDQMRLAVEASANLAAFLKKDLAPAGDMVARALASGGTNAGQLKRILGEAYQPGMDAAAMLQAINDKLGPAAQADAATYQGKIDQLNNEMGEFNETIGRVLVDNLSTVLGWFQALPEPIQSFTLAVVGIGTALTPVLVSLSSLVTILSTAGIGAALVGAFETILPFLGPAGLIAAGVIGLVAIWKNWDTIVGYVKAVYDAIKTYLVDRFNAIIGTIQGAVQKVAGMFQWLKDVTVGHSYVPDMIDAIGDEFGRLDAVMVKPAEQQLGYVASLFKRYTAMMSGNTAIGSISSGAAQKDFASWAMDMMPGLTFGGVLQGLRQGGAMGANFAGAVGQTVNNTFNIVDTESGIARRVSEEIARQLRAGTLVSG